MENYEKLYREALERARQFSEHPLLEDSSNIVEYIFPELCESEDEKIRKEIILALQYANHKGVYDKHLTWLEKQGKSKFEQCFQEGDKIVTNEDGTHFNVSQLERVAKKEPKSAWSEEDENILEAITYTVKNSGYSHCIGVSIKVMIDWLKSLKERMKGE